MNVTQLIAEIEERYPRFNRRTEPDYRGALQEYAGPRLEAAWKATMLDWRRNTPPRPADILKRLSGPVDGPAFNTRERVLWDKAWKETRRMQAGWDAQHPRADAVSLGYLDAHWKTSPFKRPPETPIAEQILSVERDLAAVRAHPEQYHAPANLIGIGEAMLERLRGQK